MQRCQPQNKFKVYLSKYRALITNSYQIDLCLDPMYVNYVIGLAGMLNHYLVSSCGLTRSPSPDP
jgi:hypothetical protein